MSVGAELLNEMGESQELRRVLHQKALKDNELVAASPEVQDYIKHDQEIIIRKSGKVHRRIFPGPSNTGKSTLLVQMARGYENDPEFQEELEAAHGKQMVGIHLSFARALIEVAERYHVAKQDLKAWHRAEAVDLMAQATTVTQLAFTNHPDLTVVNFIDLVGFTEEDLGRSLITRYTDDNNTRLVIRRPNALVETTGRSTRNYIAQHIRYDLTMNIDEWLAQRNIYPGIQLSGREQEFLNSFGLDEAWLRHWRDIYNQMKIRSNVFLRYNEPTSDYFMGNQQVRFAMYEAWLPERLQELGYDVEDKETFTLKVTFLDIQPCSGKLSTHFERVYGEGKSKHFPLYLLRDGRPLSYYSPDEIIKEMNIKTKKI